MFQMDGVLQQPPAYGIVRADQPDELAVAPVCGNVVAALVPADVGRHSRVHLEGIVDEALCEQVTTFLGEVGCHEMDTPQRRIERIHGFDRGGRFLEIGALVPRRARRTRLRVLAEPVLEHLQIGILREQMMQGRAARTHEAEYDDGLTDCRCGCRRAGMSREPLLRPQPRRELACEVGTRCFAAGIVETRLAIVAVENDTQRFEVGVVAEILGAGGLHRFFVQGGLAVTEEVRVHARRAWARSARLSSRGRVLST